MKKEREIIINTDEVLNYNIGRPSIFYVYFSYFFSYDNTVGFFFYGKYSICIFSKVILKDQVTKLPLNSHNNTSQEKTNDRFRN